jgi:hypothetical protein
MSTTLLQELENNNSYKDFIKADQQYIGNYIDARCMHCVNHSWIFFDSTIFHICDDNFSGIGVGKHFTYSETVDICCECRGFKKVLS